MDNPHTDVSTVWFFKIFFLKNKIKNENKINHTLDLTVEMLVCGGH